MIVRIEYKKTNSLIFISTLDIERLWERILRRTDLNLKYTEGYNPKVVKDFSPAIPLGVFSESEIIDFIIIEDLEIDYVLSKIKKVSPFDLFIKRGKVINEKFASLSSLTTHIEVEIAGEKVKNLNFKELELEKNIDGKLKVIELNRFIFKESENENGKMLILDSKVSLKDIMNKLNKMGLDFIITKKNNLNLQNDKLISIFDLN
ncbi:MAG TPA: TIGR03936 family radical SAM-associated protein [Caldisericia bacterium]|nr:TIGR03936 family radical SAM-associated protein [Caldisericia bacterium]